MRAKRSGGSEPVERGTLARIAVRCAVGGLQAVRRVYWRFGRPRTWGVRALCFTPHGALVLVRHSYTRGWFLPGGGRGRGEDPAEAMLRELREEIGMTRFSQLVELGEIRHRPDHRRDTESVFAVDGVEYSPALSLEIEAIGAFGLDRLPPIAPVMLARLQLYVDRGGPHSEAIGAWLSASRPPEP